MTLDPSSLQALEFWKRWLWVVSVTLGYAFLIWGGMALSRYLEAKEGF